MINKIIEMSENPNQIINQALFPVENSKISSRNTVAGVYQRKLSDAKF